MSPTRLHMLFAHPRLTASCFPHMEFFYTGLYAPVLIPSSPLQKTDDFCSRAAAASNRVTSTIGSRDFQQQQSKPEACGIQVGRGGYPNVWKWYVLFRHAACILAPFPGIWGLTLQVHVPQAASMLIYLVAAKRPLDTSNNKGSVLCRLSSPVTLCSRV